MRYILQILPLIMFTTLIQAQNVGQEGDTLKNYVDINGLKQGHWVKQHPNGKPSFEAYFIDNKPVGNFNRYDEAGRLYAHLVYDTLNDFARAEYIHSNGKIAAKGNYIAKNKDSIWLYFDENGILFKQESYNNGLKSGQFLNYTSNKTLLEEVNYEKNLKNGKWKKFYTSGSLKWESVYVNDTLQGPAKSYFENGSIESEGFFKNGLMEGSWIRYNQNGSVEKMYTYKNGVSPQANRDNETMMKELYQNKDQFVGPLDDNDVDWLRSGSR